MYNKHKGRYGYRRVTADLCKSGRRINLKTVQRLMHELGLKALIRVKKRCAPQGPEDWIAPNLLQQDFSAPAPNEKWVTDMTEFNVKGQKLHLSACLDLYGGEIIAWRTCTRPVFELAMKTLEDALERLNPGECPILHSDQGWHYKMRPFRTLIAQSGITQSMSRKGNCFDNAVIESFFGTVKEEFFRLAQCETLKQLEDGLRDYIHYYNQERIKLKLNGLSPVQFRLRNTEM